MYCRLCDIEYPKSLRFCKWCGGGLVAREAVGNQHCPTCAAEIEREWVFCNECGVDLATLGAQPRDVVCPACSATVRKGWMFCRQCGEQVATERAAERCATCGAGVRASWTFCKQCATRLKEEAPDARQVFRTVAGIPALPPEALEDAPFSNLRSGELPPLEDVIKSDNRRVVPPPRASADAAPYGGTHPLTSSRSTGHLDADALEREIRAGRPVATPTQPAPFGRLEASELIQPGSFGQAPAQGGSKPESPDVTRAYAPVSDPPGSWKEEETRNVAVAPPADAPPRESTADFASNAEPAEAAPAPFSPPVADAPPLDSTQAFASPVAPPSVTSPPPSSLGYPTSSQPPMPTIPAMPVPTGAQPAAPTPPAAWQAPSYEPQAAPRVYEASVAPSANPSYDRQPTLALPPEMPTPFPPAAAETAPAKGGGSAVKWIALGLVLMAVMAVGVVGAALAYRAWRSKQVVVTPPAPAPAPAPPTPQPEPPAPTGTAASPLVYVAGATFGMGSDDPAADDYSKPQHNVTVKSFYIEATEVTNAQYKAFVDGSGHTPPKEGWVNGAPKPGTEDWPVVYVSWDDAVAYAKWAGRRLPTEAEWELAARGTDGRRYPWGDDWDPKKGNLGKDGNTGSPEAVGRYADGRSPFGAYDMLGNVWEWTASPFTVYPGGKAAPPEGDQFKIIRGGAFDNTGKNTAMYRGFFSSDSAWPKVGFRCAKDSP